MNEPLTNSGRLVSTARLGGRLILCDGVNANLVNDGFETRLLGIRPPVTDFAAAEGTAGSVTAGVHLIAVVFAIVKAGTIFIESNPKALITVTATGAKKIELTSLPVSDSDAVTSRVVYMTKAGGSTLFRVTAQATVADNSTTTYTINVSDAALTATELSYLNEFIPAKPFVSEHRGRLLFWGDVPWLRGTVDVVNAGQTLTFHNANLTRAMENKRFHLAASNVAYVIDSVNPTAQTAHITVAYAGTTQTGQTYRILGDAHDLILSNPLPLNIEGYDVLSANGQSILPIVGDDSDQPTGIMALRDMRILGSRGQLRTLLGDPAVGELVEMVGERGPCGLASHWAWAQIPEGPLVFYAGAAGIFAIDANVPRELTKGVRPIFVNEINHELDDHAHAVWYAPRSMFLLWTASSASTKLIDKVMVGDFSDYPHLVSWWEFKLPASLSKIVNIGGLEKCILGDYWGTLRVWDSGVTDGANNVTATGTITAVTASTITDSTRAFTVNELSGVQITITSGVAAGQQRFINSNTATVLTIDTRSDFGGAFSVPTPAVGDTYALGAIESFWETPDMSTADTAEKKKWLQAASTTEPLGANNLLNLSHYGDAAGTMQLRGTTILRPVLKSAHANALSGRSSYLRLRYGTDGPSQPWHLDNFSVTATKGRGLR